MARAVCRTGCHGSHHIAGLLGYRQSVQLALDDDDGAIRIYTVGAVQAVHVHELAHLRESTHTPEFWLLVERTMPDFGERREWLARRGGRLVAV